MITDIKKEEGDVDMQDETVKNALTGVTNGRINTAAPSGNTTLTTETQPEKLPLSSGSAKKNAQPQLLKPKYQSSDFDNTDSSHASNAMETDMAASTSTFTTNSNGVALFVMNSKDGKAVQDGGERCNGASVSFSEASVLGTFRSVIPQAVFEKIKDRISASREREKLSMAKQILRKEEEKKRLARDRDAEDLESKIHDLKEKIKQEKARRQTIFAQLKEKMSLEERYKKDMAVREREREMQSNHVQHSYPNPTMLISQTNPSMQRPRLMNYPLVNVPVPVNLQLLHPDSTHMNTAVSSNSSKRHRSPSPAHIPGSSSMMERSGSSRSSHHETSHSRNHLQAPSNKQSRSNNQGSTPDLHQNSTQSSRNPSGMRSPNKSQTSTPIQQNVNSGGSQQSNVSSQQQQQPQMTMAPFAMAAPYPAAMGNQMVMVVPNMVGTGAGGQPQLMSINPALLGKGPEHMQALTPQQQQALMAQQLHAMGGLTTLNPEYFQRALQQHFNDQQRMNANAGAIQDVYRQYAAAGMMPQPMLVRTGVPQMAQMPPHSNTSSASQSASHSHQSSNAPSSHNVAGSHPSDGSQRVGSIMTGIPVFGPAMGHPSQSYGLPPASSSNHPANMYPRSGSSS